MNAEQHQHPLTGGKVNPLMHTQALNSEVSALADSELNESELTSLLATLDGDCMESWHACQVIGDVLRGHEDPTGVQSASDFLAAVRLGLASSGVPLASSSQLTADATSVHQERGHREAANDSVFRWKLVAGLASLAAVMAVSWGVVSGSGSAGAAGAQLASTSPALAAPAALAVSGVPASNAPVAVSTGQGVLIRDAQLEALLAEHRQHGGMSALQMPSGFIRNATYEAAGR